MIEILKSQRLPGQYDVYGVTLRDKAGVILYFPYSFEKTKTNNGLICISVLNQIFQLP